MGWRVFFIAAAVFNIAAGLPFLLAPDAALASFAQPVPEDLLFHRVTGLSIVCFGVGYAFVARELERNRAIVWIGALGKAGVIVLLAQAWLAGAIPFASFSVALGDLPFVAGFLVFLATKRSPA
jgi:hypothetical protein